MIIIFITLLTGCQLFKGKKPNHHNFYEAYFRKANNDDKRILEEFFLLKGLPSSSHASVNLLMVNKERFNDQEKIHFNYGNKKLSLHVGYDISTYILHIETPSKNKANNPFHQYVTKNLRKIHDVVLNSWSREIATLCLYESFLWDDEHESSTVNLFGFPINHSYQLKNLSQNSIVSDLLWIDFPENHMNHKKACEENYHKIHKKIAYFNLRGMKTNIRFNIPKQRCTIPDIRTRQKLSFTSPKGDPSCLSWFGERDQSTQKGAVARCIGASSSSKSGFCQLRAKSKSPILLLRLPGGQITPYLGSSQAKLATSPFQSSFLCDETINSSPQLSKEGSWLFSYEGYCIPPVLFNQD